MKSDHVRAIAVYGASGHTGRFVVRELMDREIPVVVSGRDEARLRQLFGSDSGKMQVRPASVNDPYALEAAFSGCAAVINCAGPFLDTARQVARAALAAKAHYLDITAEQQSAWDILREFDRPARSAGLTAIPAAGFFGGMADLLVGALLAGAKRADAIDIAIMLDSWHPTDGTRKTGARNTAIRQMVTGGKLSPLSQPAPQREWEFGSPWGIRPVIELPFSEVPLISQRIVTGELHTYLSRAALDDIRNPATPAPVAADASGLSAQRFHIEARVVQGGLVSTAIAAGRDIYAVTAPLVCEAATRVIANAPEAGAHPPADLLDAADVLRTLANRYGTLKGDLPDAFVVKCQCLPE